MKALKEFYITWLVIQHKKSRDPLEKAYPRPTNLRPKIDDLIEEEIKGLKEWVSKNFTNTLQLENKGIEDILAFSEVCDIQMCSIWETLKKSQTDNTRWKSELTKLNKQLQDGKDIYIDMLLQGDQNKMKEMKAKYPNKLEKFLSLKIPDPDGTSAGASNAMFAASAGAGDAMLAASEAVLAAAMGRPEKPAGAPKKPAGAGDAMSVAAEAVLAAAMGGAQPPSKKKKSAAANI
jgi:hypothetical protein